jgi:hypothetical protein
MTTRTELKAQAARLVEALRALPIDAKRNMQGLYNIAVEVDAVDLFDRRTEGVLREPAIAEMKGLGAFYFRGYWIVKHGVGWQYYLDIQSDLTKRRRMSFDDDTDWGIQMQPKTAPNGAAEYRTVDTANGSRHRIWTIDEPPLLGWRLSLFRVGMRLIYEALERVPPPFPVDEAAHAAAKTILGIIEDGK